MSSWLGLCVILALQIRHWTFRSIYDDPCMHYEYANEVIALADGLKITRWNSREDPNTY